MPENWSFHHQSKFLFDVRNFFWDEQYLFQICANNIIWRFVHDIEMMCIWDASSLIRDHYSGILIAHRILQYRYYFLIINKDVHDYVKACDQWKREGGLSSKHKLPLTPILVINLFDIWGIDFMGSFVSSNGMNCILVAVTYVYKWVEAIKLPNSEDKSFTTFVKHNIF